MPQDGWREDQTENEYPYLPLSADPRRRFPTDYEGVKGDLQLLHKLKVVAQQQLLQKSVFTDFSKCFPYGD